MRKIFIIFHFLTLLIMSSTSTAMPEPYNSIELLAFDEHGWFANKEPLERLILQRNPQIAIEVGSWLGSSTRFIAKTMAPNTKLYAVDTWLGSPNEPLHLQDPRLPYLYQLFLSNVIHTGLTDKIVPMRMSSQEAANALKMQADLIYIDASHDTYSVIDDILRWNGHLKPGALLCGDDWGWESVRVAVAYCAALLGKNYYAEGNFWWYE